jgi:hypothetical protein
MIKFFLIFLLPFSLYASKILSYNIYDRTDRVDVMITFDTPYEGIIKQNSTKSKIVIKLLDAQIESSKIKNLSTNFLKSLTITPMSEYTQIVASVPSGVHLRASKTSDSYGLRLRFTNQIKTQSTKTTDAPNLSKLPTKSDSGMSQSYYIVVTILIIGIIILFVLKRKIANNTPQNNTSPWLFNKTQTKDKDEVAPIQTQQETAKNNNISIRFQKDINNENSVIMLDFGEQSYLVLMGKNNILLDKFTENKPSTQEDFESILQSRHQELDEFLKVNHYQDKEEKEPLQVYKEKAASLIYEEDN